MLSAGPAKQTFTATRWCTADPIEPRCSWRYDAQAEAGIAALSACFGPSIVAALEPVAYAPFVSRRDLSRLKEAL